MAALGVALSGCGSDAGATAAASAAQSSAVTQSPSSPGSAPPQSSGTTQNTPAAQSATAGSGSAAGSGSSGSGPSPGTHATSVTINWTPPTENTDGTTLRNLAGYNIHYGTASHKYTQTISITNPGIATYVVESLSPGTYYFAVAAVNSTGTESPLSAEVSTTLN